MPQMSTSRKYACLVMLVLFAFTSGLQAKERHYAQLYSWAQGVQWVNARPDRQYVEAFIQVRSHERNIPIEKVRLVIHASGGDRMVALPASGVLTLPIDGDLITEDPVVEFSSRVGVTVVIRASAPPRQDFDYGLIGAMVREYTETVSRQNFLPDQFQSVHVRGLALRGDGIAVHSSCGVVARKRGDALVIDYDPQLPADCKVELSRMPDSMELMFKWF